jgi:hypothetical protein
MLTSGILSGLDMITLSPLADAQSNSRTDSEQDISQKNTCSGFSECLNDGANLVEADSRAFCFVADVTSNNEGESITVRETFCFPTLQQCEEESRIERGDSSVLVEPCRAVS